MAEVLASLAGGVLALAAEYLPGFSDWFARLDGRQKRLLMVGLLALVSLAVYGVACAGLAGELFPLVGSLAGQVLPALRCDEAGAIALAQAFLSALAVNQGVYLLARRTYRPMRVDNLDLVDLVSDLDGDEPYGEDDGFYLD
jgi:hypothetical protein